jgi:hypothetical protein
VAVFRLRSGCDAPEADNSQVSLKSAGASSQIVKSYKIEGFNMAGESYTITIKDFSKELSTTSVNVGAVTAASLPGLLSDIDDYKNAVDGLVVGVLRSDELRAFKTSISTANPASAQAQRERKFMVTYADNLPFFDDPVNAIPNAGFGKIFNFEIPTADFSLADLFPTNTDEVDLAQTEIAAFVTAFETMARSPYGGTVEVLAITGVGRNN